MILIINVHEINMILPFFLIKQTQGRPNAHFLLSFSRKPKPEVEKWKPFSSSCRSLSLVYLDLMFVYDNLELFV